MNIKGFAVFAVIAYIAMMLGTWVATALGMTGSQNIAFQAVAFLIPIGILYYAWKRVQNKVS